MNPLMTSHDLSYAVVARAPIQEIEQFKKQMGWDFTWVSSFNNDFNFDFNVSFTDAQLAAGRGYYNFRAGNPGLADLSGDSVFVKDPAGQVYHTYSTFGRGGGPFFSGGPSLDPTPQSRRAKRPPHCAPPR